MSDFKRWIDVGFGLVGAALMLGPLVACWGCTADNPADRSGDTPRGPLAGVLAPVPGSAATVEAEEGEGGAWGSIWPDDAGDLADLGDADAGEALAVDASGEADLLPLSAMTCAPFTAGALRWTLEACEGLGEGEPCDNLGQWTGEARCVRFGLDFCRDNPRTSLDECFACAPCSAR